MKSLLQVRSIQLPISSSSYNKRIWMDASPNVVHIDENCVTDKQPILCWIALMYVIFVFSNFSINDNYNQAEIRIISCAVMLISSSILILFAESQCWIHHRCSQSFKDSSKLPIYTQTVRVLFIKLEHTIVYSCVGLLRDFWPMFQPATSVPPNIYNRWSRNDLKRKRSMGRQIGQINLYGFLCFV